MVCPSGEIRRGFLICTMTIRKRFTAPKEKLPIKETICSSCDKKRPYANKTKKLCITCLKKQQIQKKKDQRTKIREKKKYSISTLTKKLDTVFSVYVRLLHCDNRGMVRCFTCDRVEPWRKIQNGHFQSRRFMSTRFHLANCAPQCYACNVGMSGMQYEYGKRIDKNYGPGTADEIVLLSRQIKKFTADELVELIERTEEAVKSLRLSKNIWD